MNSTLKKHLSFLIKLAVTAGLFWWIFDGIDLTALRDRAEKFSIATGIVCVAALVGQTFIAALRLRLLGGFVAAGVGLVASWQYSLIGFFFNQVLPSTIGGDAVKAWLLSQRESWNLRLALHCVVIDRALGMLSLIIVITVTLPWIFEIIPNKQAVTGIAFVLVAGIAALLAFLFLPRLPEFLERNRIIGELLTFRDTFRRICTAPRVLGPAAVYGVSMYLLNVCVVWYVAQAVDIDASFIECLVIVPTALLISVAPISIAGWGLREGAMVAGFALVGTSAVDAVFLSVTLGAGMTVVGLLGGLVWLLSAAPKPPLDNPPSEQVLESDR